ncbi:hypothetical protein [[Clostridium] fimetarium]|nr:hypothetical protein [[Clostridium] fimetarium]
MNVLEVDTLKINVRKLRCSQTEYINTYIQKTDNIVHIADVKLSMNIYSQKGTFVRADLLKTRYDFSNMKNISVQNGNYKGFESASEYTATFFFALMILFVIVIGFFYERKSGLNMIIHSTPGGRGRLLLQRILILFAISLIVSVIFEYHGNLLSKEIAVQKKVLEKIIEEQNYRDQQYEIYNRKLSVIKQPEYQVMTGSRMDSFEEYNAVLAVISVIIVTFGTISFEKKNNMIKLITSSTKGYKKNMIIKVSAALTCTFVIWAVIYGINFYNYIKVYNICLSDLKYPVQSIMSLSDYPFPISICGYFLIESLKRLSILILVSLWSLFISWRTDYNYSICLSFIILIPYILYFFGFNIFSYISVINWMI